MGNDIDTALLKLKQKHSLTLEAFKGQNRRQLVSVLKRMREYYNLMDTAPTDGEIVLLLAVPPEGTGYLLIIDEGRGAKENLQQVKLESLLPLADIVSPLVFHNAEIMGQASKSEPARKAGRGGRRAGSGRPRSYSADQVDEVKRLRDAGQSLRKIAEQVGLSLGTVQNIVKG